MKWTWLKLNVIRYKPLETATIFFQEICLVYVIVDFICMGYLELEGAKTENYKMIKTCVCETQMSLAATKSIYGKISKSYILIPPHVQGHVMSVKCKQPLDELTVQILLLYNHPNFKYCTLIISGTEVWTDRRRDKRTEDPNSRCPRRAFQAGGIKLLPTAGLEVTTLNHKSCAIAIRSSNLIHYRQFQT